MNIARLRWAAFAAGSVASIWGSALGQASFQGLAPSQPGGTSYAAGVSGDGSTVVGTVRTFAPGTQSAAVWVNWAGPPTLLPTAGLGVVLSADAARASRDGSVVVGRGANAQGLVRGIEWSAASGAWLAGLQVGQGSAAYACTADGGVAVGGVGQGQAVRWVDGAAEPPLATPSGLPRSTLHDVSGSGTVIGGQVGPGPNPSVNFPTRWTSTGAGGPYSVDQLSPSEGRAIGVSPDGSVVVGSMILCSSCAAKWFRGGDTVLLTNPPGMVGGHAWDASRRGARIVGSSRQGSRRRATLWNAAAAQGVSIKTLLEQEHGLDLTGWTLEDATGISDDGTVIVGYGVDPDGDDAGWVAVIPLECGADWNFDGVVNSTDVSDFINEWYRDQEEATQATDADENGVVNSTDVSAYINLWFEQVVICGK